MKETLNDSLNYTVEISPLSNVFYFTKHFTLIAQILLYCILSAPMAHLSSFTTHFPALQNRTQVLLSLAIQCSILLCWCIWYNLICCCYKNTVYTLLQKDLFLETFRSVGLHSLNKQQWLFCLVVYLVVVIKINVKYKL